MPVVILNAFAGNDISIYGKVGNEVKNIDLVRMICTHLDVMPPKEIFYTIRSLSSPTAPAMTCAMRLILHASAKNSIGAVL